MTNLTTIPATTLWSMPWWQWLVVIAGLTVAICTIVWFIIRVTRGKLKIGGLEVSADDNTNEKHYKCSTCAGRGELAFIIKRLLDLTIQEHDLRIREILATQMMKTEEKLLDIKNECLAKFISTLSPLLIELNVAVPPIQHQDYLYYKLVLSEFLIKMKDMLRSAAINNGFSVMSVQQYDEYINQQTDKIRREAFTFFQENYVIAKVIKPEILQKTPIILDNLNDKIRSIFDAMKERELKIREKIKKLNDTRQEIVEKGIGIDGVV